VDLLVVMVAQQSDQSRPQTHPIGQHRSREQVPDLINPLIHTQSFKTYHFASAVPNRQIHAARARGGLASFELRRQGSGNGTAS
jgi:hypothetical protein